jgi:hypothetical protein
VAELAAIQQRLIGIAASTVKPGGKLVYAVCTLTRAETDGVCDAFTAAHPEFVPEPVADPFGVLPPAARHTFWPQQTKGNGMFVAVWKRVASAATPGGTSPASDVETPVVESVPASAADSPAAPEAPAGA